MASKRAKFVNSFLRVTSNKKGYKLDRISWHRKKFARDLNLIFPSFGFKKIPQQKIAGVNTAWFMPPTKTDRTILYIHGGGFVFGSLKTHHQHTARLARLCKANVLAVDYSLSPENPYPAALDELLNVWQEIIKNIDITKTAIMGESAGGNLAMALLLKIREAGLPQPACAVLLSPALDATFSGESYERNKLKDPILNMLKLNFFLDAYVGNMDKHNPFISPIFAKLDGLAPILVHAGSDEILLSDSETIAENAKRDNADITLLIAKSMWHGWHLFAFYVPEAKAAMKQVAEFFKNHTN
ncbi:MAG: Alpha/beta hydrolase fold-3 domain protein [Candidatus Saccharibacteria bacterium]|nr:Alpha/beta hydrolase fold-3 domain protein [Candidatus Saccharibacteria bacterium]